MENKFSTGDPVVVINNKLATFGKTGKVTEVTWVAGIMVRVDHDGNGEENLYEPHSLARGIELPFPQRPFEWVIMKDIERRIPQILYSSKADEEIRLLGQILRSSIIPEWRMELVVKRLKEVAKRLSPSGDEKDSRFYLEHLADEIEGRFFKWSGDSA